VEGRGVAVAGGVGTCGVSRNEGHFWIRNRSQGRSLKSWPAPISRKTKRFWQLIKKRYALMEIKKRGAPRINGGGVV